MMGGVGRVLVVSGGGAGIGKAIAERIAREGGKVTVLAHRAEVLHVAAGEIKGVHPYRQSRATCPRTRGSRAGAGEPSSERRRVGQQRGRAWRAWF